MGASHVELESPRAARAAKRSRVEEKKAAHHASRVIRIAHVEEAPAFMKLPSLMYGYRLNHTLSDALYSLFTWHLDTVNIWTHLLGFVYYCYAMTRVYDELERERAGWMDYLMFTGCLLGAQFQMAASALYHTFRCVDFDTDALLLRLDLGGIAAMILGAYFIGMVNAFVCAPAYTALYLAILAAILAAIGVMASWPDFQRPEYDHIRNMVFGSAVGFSVWPVGHWVLEARAVGGPGGEKGAALVLALYLSMMGLYLVGYSIFMARWPEKFARGYDLAGASHQIWHTFVWAAGAVWIEGMLEYRRWRVVHQGHCTTGAWWSADLPALAS